MGRNQIEIEVLHGLFWYVTEGVLGGQRAICAQDTWGEDDREGLGWHTIIRLVVGDAATYKWWHLVTTSNINSRLMF